MIQIIRVTGSSLSPDFQEGDFVVIVKIPFLLHLKRIKPGDVMVFNHPDYGVMMKRVQRISAADGEIFVLGTHPSSVDSRQFGPIRQGNLIGKVIWHISRKQAAA